MSSTFSKKQIELFISHSNAIENEPFECDEESWEAWKLLRKSRDINPDVIKRAHGILLQNKPLRTKFKGEFRDQPVWIGGKKLENIVSLPNEVEEWCKMLKSKIERSTLAQMDVHIAFEEIHPFIDGNGRIGRLLFLLYRLKFGKSFLYFDVNLRHKYYEYFNGKKNLLFLKQP